MSLFIGKLSSKVTKADLEDAFSKFGVLNRCDLRGSHAFLTFNEMKDAEAARSSLQGSDMGGVSINIEWTKESGRYHENAPREASARSGGGGGGGSFTCHGCGKQGHFVRDCPERGRSGGAGGGGGGGRRDDRDRYYDRDRDRDRDRDYRDRDDRGPPRGYDRRDYDRDRDRDYPVRDRYDDRYDSRRDDRGSSSYDRKDGPRDRSRSRSRERYKSPPRYRSPPRINRDAAPPAGERDRSRSREKL